MLYTFRQTSLSVKEISIVKKVLIIIIITIKKQSKTIKKCAYKHRKVYLIGKFIIQWKCFENLINMFTGWCCWRMVCPPGWRWGWGGVGGGANCRKRGYIDIVLEIEYSQLSLRPTPLGPTPSVRFRESNKGSKLKTGTNSWCLSYRGVHLNRCLLRNSRL